MRLFQSPVPSLHVFDWWKISFPKAFSSHCVSWFLHAEARVSTSLLSTTNLRQQKRKRQLGFLSRTESWCSGNQSTTDASALEEIDISHEKTKNPSEAVVFCSRQKKPFVFLCKLTKAIHARLGHQHKCHFFLHTPTFCRNQRKAKTSLNNSARLVSTCTICFALAKKAKEFSSAKSTFFLPVFLRAAAMQGGGYEGLNFPTESWKQPLLRSKIVPEN